MFVTVTVTVTVTMAMAMPFCTLILTLGEDIRVVQDFVIIDVNKVR